MDNFLSQAECLRIIEHAMNNLKHDFEETRIDESVKLNEYDGISCPFIKLN